MHALCICPYVQSSSVCGLKCVASYFFIFYTRFEFICLSEGLGRRMLMFIGEFASTNNQLLVIVKFLNGFVDL